MNALMPKSPTPVTSASGTSASGTSTSGTSTSGTSTAAATTVAQPEPVRIASPDDPDVIAARKNAMRRTMQDRGGRDSTDLDRPPAYNRTQLG